MGKVELADKLHKLSHGRKKNIKNSKTIGKKFEIKKDSVALSSKAVSLNKPDASKKSPEIRMDLVHKYRGDISSGIYKVRTEEIAEKMIQKYKEQTYDKLHS